MSSSAKTLTTAFFYVALVIAAVVAFLFISSRGETLIAPPPAVDEISRAVSAASSSILTHLLLALAAVVAVGRLLGRLFTEIGQPPIIGEVLGGILLGPSFLGMISMDAYHFILPANVAPYLGIVGQLGVIIYMFLVGLELDAGFLRGRVNSTIATSHASIVLPFVLGAGLALYLYPRFSTSNIPFTNFALFMGLAMSITAFPVLARILSDTGMTRTELGTIALTCAAVDDVTAWCLLAFVVGVVQTSANSALLVAALTLGFIGFMFIVVRPLAGRLIRKSEGREPSKGTIALIVVLLLASALTTEAIGIHAIFGAFLFGAVIPHSSNIARSLRESLENLVTILLLPAFFAFTGMRTEIGLVSGTREWLVCGLIILVATLGKFGGSFLAGRLTGLSWRHSAGLGVLMNTRGLMELIVLNVGFELGVISSTLYTMMVLMALVTTIATTPILHRLVLKASR